MPVILVVLGFFRRSAYAPWDTRPNSNSSHGFKANPTPSGRRRLRSGSPNYRLAQVQDAYSHGRIEEGAKLVANLMDTIRTSWKLLQGSGRKASKQPDGFRDFGDFSSRICALATGFGTNRELSGPCSPGECGAGNGTNTGRPAPRLVPGGHPANLKRLTRHQNGDEPGESNRISVIAACAP